MLSQASLRKVIACSVADDMKPLTRLLFKLTKGRKIKSVPSESTYIQWQDFLALGQRDPSQVFADRKPYERMIDPKACAVYLHSAAPPVNRRPSCSPLSISMPWRSRPANYRPGQ
jgi:hypothetical protein